MFKAEKKPTGAGGRCFKFEALENWEIFDVPEFIISN
jgi:hypothetical protein